LVVIRENEQELFLRDGDDVILDIEITFPQAALGAEVEVPTLTGHSLLKIQSGTQSGTLLRMRDKGIPHLNRGGKGDQLVRVQIVTPSKLSKEEKKLLEQLAEREHFRATAAPSKTDVTDEREQEEAEPGFFNNLKTIFS
jgi:molecular chaperone DnaJ